VQHDDDAVLAASRTLAATRTGMTRSSNRCDVTITVDSDGHSLNAHRPDDSKTRHPDGGMCST
jgi:hypothetical protein